MVLNAPFMHHARNRYATKGHVVQNDKSAKTEKPWARPLKMFPSMYME